MRVVVVGGGLSGLFTASELLSEGIGDVVVLERSSQPGGVARTTRRDGFMLEPAAGSVSLPHPHLSPILDRIGAEMFAIERGAAARYVFVDDRLVRVPASPRALLAPVVPWNSKLRVLAEPLIGRAPQGLEESLQMFCERRFGRTTGAMLAWLMASGVYAGDPELLSARSAFPILVGLEDHHGSVMRGAISRRRSRPSGVTPRSHVPRGGMAALAETAASSLGSRFRGGFSVESVRRDGTEWVVEGDESMRADAVVVAARPEDAARILDGDLADHLIRLTSSPVAVIGLGGVGGSVPPGFGALIGPGPLATLGVLFESSYGPDRAPDGSWLIKVIAGGATRPEVIDWDDGALIDRILEEASLILGRELDPSFTEVVRHQPGIPQPEIGHAEWLSTVDRLLADRPGLHLTGWGYRGVGLTHLATDAVRVAKAVAGSVERE